MKITFIGFGEAGRAFHDSLKEVVPDLEFSAYDILLDREGFKGPMGQAMLDRSVAIAMSSEHAVSGADWIFSAVTADQSTVAASAAASGLKAGQVFIDINSVAPDTKRANAAIIGEAGAAYADMAVMAPVDPRGHRTPVFVAGHSEDGFAARLGELGFDFEIVGAEPGAATAIKMVRSLFVKGLEAITVEALLAARASGCLPRVLDSLAKSYPGLDWPKIAEYHFERTLKHGIRRAAEMHESAVTLDQLGLHGALADAIADVEERMGEAGRQGAAADGFEGLLDEVLRLRGVTVKARAK